MFEILICMVWSEICHYSFLCIHLFAFVSTGVLVWRFFSKSLVCTFNGSGEWIL